MTRKAFDKIAEGIKEAIEIARGTAMTNLAELIERLEKASGPDKAIDSAIADMIVGVGRIVIGGDPRYTASIDVALTLVPEGWSWALDRVGNECAAVVDPTAVYISDHLSGPGASFATTPALALCIAALKARAALKDQP